MDRLKNPKLWVAVGAILIVVGSALTGTLPADQAVEQIAKLLPALAGALGGN